MIVDLSVDFDFFVREELVWDWGHREPDAKERGEYLMWLISIWNIRYASWTIDIFAETDMVKYADFMPEDLPAELSSRGIIPMQGKRGQLAVAESHTRAYDFFSARWSEKGPPNALINIDAHHDLWPFKVGTPIHCGNWLTALARDWPGVGVTQVYPWWKDPLDDGPPALARPHITKWADWHPDGAQVRNVFLCRSGVWVPPHQDKHFIDLFHILGWWFMRRNSVPRVLEDILQRKAPTQEEADKMRQLSKAQWETYMAMSKEAEK